MKEIKILKDLYRGEGSCGGIRKFDGSGKGIGKLKSKNKTSKQNKERRFF